MTPREIAIKVMWAKLDQPYIWSGDDPIAGMDCSGGIIEALKSAGRLPRSGDWKAWQLYGMFPIPKLSKLPTKDVLFFGGKQRRESITSKCAWMKPFP